MFKWILYFVLHLVFSLSNASSGLFDFHLVALLVLMICHFYQYLFKFMVVLSHFTTRYTHIILQIAYCLCIRASIRCNVNQIHEKKSTALMPNHVCVCYLLILWWAMPKTHSKNVDAASMLLTIFHVFGERYLHFIPFVISISANEIDSLLLGE